jgi:hypothetical protein
MGDCAALKAIITQRCHHFLSFKNMLNSGIVLQLFPQNILICYIYELSFASLVTGILAICITIVNNTLYFATLMIQTCMPSAAFSSS